MKTYTTLYQNKKHLKEFLSTLESSPNASVLVQLFCGVSDEELLQNVLDLIYERFHGAVVIGASTAGEIFEGDVVENSIVISISVFEESSLISHSTSGDDSFLIGQDIAKNIVVDDTKAVILFADGIKCNGEAILEGFKSVSSKNLVLAGGMAGDNFEFKNTFVIHQKNIIQSGVVAVSLNGETLIAHNNYSLAWEPVGLPMTVTKAEGNIVYEIDNKPIIEIYSQYLGEDVVERLPGSALEFPFVFKKEGILVARDILGTQDGAVMFAGEIPVGTQVRFAIASTKFFMDNSNRLIKTNSQIPVESIYVYSCAARKKFLGENLSIELKPLSRFGSVNGFFTYGEIYSENNNAQLLNITMTMLVLSESNTIIKQRGEGDLYLDKNVSLSTPALIHFINRTIEKLDEESSSRHNLIAELNQYQQAIDKTFIVSKADTKGIITYANDLFCEISGYTKGELVAHSHNIVRHPDMPKEVYKELWESIEAKKIWQGVIKNRRKDGKSYYTDAVVFPILDKNGEIIEFVGIRKDITDITKQKLKTEAIINAEDNIVLLASYIKINNETKVQTKRINQTFFQLFDYKDIEDFLTKHTCVCELFVEREGYLSINIGGLPWIDYLVENQDKTHLAIMVDKRGYERVFSTKARLVNLETHDFMIITFSDVTELERARVEALAAERAKSTFLSTMSHELRTPLNAVIGFSQILMHKTDMPTEMLKTYIEKINVAGSHLLSLINNILDFSKLESDKMELHLEEVNLAELCDSVAMMLESSATKKDITIVKEYPQDLFLRADKQLLSQVVINIIGNAIKFTPEGKKITLGCTSNTKGHYLSICDEGIGLSADQIATIFSPFSQIKEHQEGAIKGTGLGLSISKKIMELHHGSIEVVSKPNEGSCFTLVLPKAK